MKKLEVIKKCTCCNKEFTLEDVTSRIKSNVMPMYDGQGNLRLYLFNCDCGSTLAIKFEIIDIDNKNLAPLKESK